MWLTNFDPTVGAETKKIRPTIIISSDGIDRLPIKLIAPITDWKNSLENDSWHIKIEPNLANNLTKVSTVDILQIRGIDLQKLVKKIDICSGKIMKKISIGIALLVEYDS
ncbi:type II toxin-antitoxin system PemK/MazF family toxin [Okeania sp.]|uniref:type II toxin-antitoxin system PemK/MazF family toxin n=1 Tax=Okeania sp. TaxID=3100323 RepID=UPI002B4B93EF|nr:type II toxin-antitoxin system PemK/MazF family toxin [Okeania sp.]MEB3342881.1 type II toxin-antitoxin system PemK/MazF family toxin [Okeania sp.]